LMQLYDMDEEEDQQDKAKTENTKYFVKSMTFTADL
jgi:hypothetical protein